MAVRLGAEIQFYAMPEAPFQRHFVNAHCRLTAVHGGREVPRRVHVRAVVRGDLQGFHRSTLGVRKVLRLEPGNMTAICRPPAATPFSALTSGTDKSTKRRILMVKPSQARSESLALQKARAKEKTRDQWRLRARREAGNPQRKRPRNPAVDPLAKCWKQAAAELDMTVDCEERGGWLRYNFMDTPLVSALLHVILGGLLVFLAVVLIGNSREHQADVSSEDLAARRIARSHF